MRSSGGSAKLKRKARGGIRCLREHGWKYTLFLIAEKAVRALWPPLAITVFFFARILPAYHWYAALKKKSGGAYIYCQYYPGSGDVRYSAAYLKLVFERGFHFVPNNAVFVVSGGSATKVAELFCPPEIPIIPLGERAPLSMVHLMRFVGQETLDMTILHYFDDTMYTAVLFPVMSRKNITFEDLYTIALLNDSGMEWPEPDWDDDEEWAVRFFAEHNLEPHKTVLISPFANSLAYGPDQEFWECIVAELKREGFSVCTNVAGSREKPVRGSAGVSIPYKYLNIFLRRAGYFLAFRSGLCELAAQIPCRKLILYPDKMWPDAERGHVSTMDLFSLQRMDWGKNTVEFIYRPDVAPETIVQALHKQIFQS